MDTKALRQKVLDLAIRGKLVPQDPNDEPASVLLERIRQQKQQMVKEGKLKAKDIKNDTIIFVGEDNLHYEKFADGSVKCIEDEIPFDLPDGWAWARLGPLIELFITGPFGSALHKSDYVADGIPLINPMNIIDGKIVPIDKMQVSPETVERLSSFKVAPTDIVIARRGDMGRCAVVRPDQEGWLCGTGSFVLRIPSALCSEYFAVCLRSPYSVEYLSGNSIGNTMLNLNQAILKSILLPVPPRTEQNRIINAIFDSDIHLAEITKQREALVIYVAKAKDKILDLAIRGQLVPQNPDDEPASVLLERIRAEKEELIKQGKIKRDKKESVIFHGEDNSYYAMIDGVSVDIAEYLGFELPDGWTWITLKDIATITSGKTPKPDQLSTNGSVPYFKVADMNTPGNELYLQQADCYINDQYSGPVFDGGSFVFPKNGGAVLTNKKRILENASVVDLNTGVFTPSKLLDKVFIFFLFSSIDFSKIHKGAVIPTVDSSVIGNLIYGLPPIEEQKRIANAVKNFFAQVEQLEKALS